MERTFYKKLDNGKELMIAIKYCIGNSSCYRPVKRGYYLNVDIVERCENLITFCPSDGIRCLLHEVSRQGKNAEIKAIERSYEVLPEMIERLEKRHGFKVVEVA